MGTNIIYPYAPAVLAVVFGVVLVHDLLRAPAIVLTQRFGRRRNSFLILCFLCMATFGGRAIELVMLSHNNAKDSLDYFLEQTLLQLTVFLTLLASSDPSPTPYLTIWLLTLVAEIALVLTQLFGERASTKLHLGLSTSAIVTLVLLSLGAATTISTITVPGTHGEQESLLSARNQPSDTPSGTAERPNRTAYDSLSESITSSMKLSSGADKLSDTESLRSLDSPTPSNLLTYCASYKIFIPHVIPTKNLRLQLYLALVIVSILLRGGLNVLSPYLLGRIVDKLTRTHELPVLDIIFCVVTNMLSSDSFGLTGLNDMLLGRLNAWSRKSLTVAAFDKIMSLSAEFHDSKDSGEVIKAVEQAESLSALFNTLVDSILPAILDLTIALGYLNYLLDFHATLIVIAVGVVFFFATIFTSRQLHSSRRELAEAERAESEVIYEAVSNWPTISYFNRRIFEIARLSKAAEGIVSAEVRNNDSIVLMFAAQEATERAGLISILLLAAFRIYNGTSTIGKFVSVERYWTIITHPLYVLGQTYRRSATHLIDSERLLQLFQTEAKVKDRPGAQALQLDKGRIEFSHVKFAYEPSRTIVQDLNLTIQPGHTVALVGATGSGKSTLTKLLMRFYDINSGEILIDNQDVSTVTLDSLRAIFGVVPQESVLFNTSVLENVRYGKLDATDEDIYAACKAACIHDRILSLPSGYLTRVGERGVKLSGGERQRIAVARVLLKDPPIVILDEATSAMDSQTESEIQKSLAILTTGRTCIVVAHRLSTVVDADVILVVDRGCVVERGTHVELLQARGRYFDMWERQTTAQSDGSDTSTDGGL